MNKFEIGKKYKHGWIGDADLFTVWEVVKRTEKTVTVKENDTVKTCRIKEDNNGEFIFPLGVYSMCPVLRATNEVAADNKRELAERIYNLFPWWDIPDDVTPETIVQDIEERPTDIIKALLDMIENE